MENSRNLSKIDINEAGLDADLGRKIENADKNRAKSPI
jgi:hypothetical protein